MTKKSGSTGEVLYTVSPAPYLTTGDTVSGLINSVTIALLPAAICGVYIFGVEALVTILTAISACVVCECLYNWMVGKEYSLTDGSAVLTGLLLGLNLPPVFPWWMTVSGAFFAIVLVKEVFGGVGFNIFNPALAARVFLLISWPVQMSRFPVPERVFMGVDAISQATPLTAIKTVHLAHDPSASILSITQMDWLPLLFGSRGGSIGEVSILALLLGGVYLLYKGTITWHIPGIFLLSAFLTATLFKVIDPGQAANPLFHVLNGGLILGALFMATDYVTSPFTGRGMIIFAAGCGFLTILIRQFGSYPEGVSFAILIMNMFVPLIDRYVRAPRFGQK